MKIHFIAILCMSQWCAAQQRPNIVHIIADDMGWDDFSAYGSANYHTPHIDQMARHGVQLMNYYAPHSTCTPTRAALLTGRYAPRMNNGTGLGVLFPTDTIGLDAATETSFTTLLKQNGYATALFGKWHLGHLKQYLPAVHGFDEFLGIPYPNDHGPERLGNTGSRGFPPIPLIHNTEKIKDLANADLAELPHRLVRSACQYITEKVNRKEPFYLQYANIETHTPWFIPAGFGGDTLGAYADAVSYFDRSVGVLLEHLRQLGITGNTIIILQSDNGPLVERYAELENCYGQFATVNSRLAHQLRQGKYQDRYEGGQRVPCIVQWPGHIPAGKKLEAIVSGVDWFPTLLALAGIHHTPAHVIDGKNILPLLLGQSNVPVRNTYYSFPYKSGPAAIRVDQWKLVRPITEQGEWELYDLLLDPAEKMNRAPENKELTIRLQKLLENAASAIASDNPLTDWNNINN